MRCDPLIRAWLVLIALSATATALAGPWVGGVTGRGAGVAILMVAGVKAHVILSRYLGLAAAPGARRAFDLAVAAFVLAAAGLYLAA